MCNFPDCIEFFHVDWIHRIKILFIYQISEFFCKVFSTLQGFEWLACWSQNSVVLASPEDNSNKRCFTDRIRILEDVNDLHCSALWNKCCVNNAIRSVAEDGLEPSPNTFLFTWLLAPNRSYLYTFVYHKAWRSNQATFLSNTLPLIWLLSHKQYNFLVYLCKSIHFFAFDIIQNLHSIHTSWACFIVQNIDLQN